MKILRATIHDARGRPFKLTSLKPVPRQGWTRLKVGLPHWPRAFALVALGNAVIYGAILGSVFLAVRRARRQAMPLVAAQESGTAVLDQELLLNWLLLVAIPLAVGLILAAFRGQTRRIAIGAALGVHRCPSCWYDLAGAPAGDGVRTCPECGGQWRANSSSAAHNGVRR